MAKGDTKTNQYLDIAANGTRADFPASCCETRSQTLIREVGERIMDLEDEVERLENNPDVADIVATYADLQSYDTSQLTDKDVIRVLQDETHDGDSTYYRWSTSTNTWTYIGESKQYTDFVGTDGTEAGEAGLVPAPATTDAGKFLGASGLWEAVQGGGGVTELTPADYDYPDANPDGVALWQLDGGLYTTVDNSTKLYVNNITASTPAAGTTWLLIKNPASNNHSVSIIHQSNGTDVPHAYVTNINNGNSIINDKSLGSSTVVQTTGTSTTDVMSQNATTSMVYADPATRQKVTIGAIQNNGSYGTAIGYQSHVVSGNRTVALGYRAEVNANGGVALGTGANAARIGEVNIGSSGTAYGFNNTTYRVIGGVHDGQNAHDAATVGQVNATIDAINTALSTNIPHIGA